MKTFLPGLRAVGLTDANSLPADLPLLAKAGLPVPIMADITWIPLCGAGHTASVTTQGRGPDSTSTAELTFRTDSPLSLPPCPAWVVTDQEGLTYIIGAAEPPFPKTAQKIDFGAPGSPAGITYTVSHTAIRTLIPCRLPI